MKYVPENSEGFASGGFALLDNKTILEKTIVRPTYGPDKHWRNEARFYSSLSQHLSVGGIYIPEFYGLVVVNESTIKLRLRYVEGCSPVVAPSDRERLCFRFGVKGATANVMRLYRTDWLPVSGGIGLTDSHPLVRDARSLMEEVRSDGWPVFQLFLDKVPEIRKLYLKGIPTLCHGDASRYNILVQANSERFFVIDWARVHSGMIGDDLCRLVYPAIVFFDDDYVDEAESCMVDRYIEGVQSVMPADRHSIITAFKIRAVALALSIADFLREEIAEAADEPMRKLKTERLRAYYEKMARHASDILAMI